MTHRTTPRQHHTITIHRQHMASQSLPKGLWAGFDEVGFEALRTGWKGQAGLGKHAPLVLYILTDMHCRRETLHVLQHNLPSRVAWNLFRLD